MKRIKSFDSVSESVSDSDIFRTKVSTYRRQNPTMIEFYKEPKELYMANVVDGEAEWTIDIQARRWGIEIGPQEARLKSLRLELEIDDEETGETHEDTLELSEDDFNPERYETEINQFPLELDTIEITMNNSLNPKDWNIKLVLGKISDY